MIYEMAIKVTVKKVEGKNGYDFEKGIKFNVDIDGTLTFKKDSTIGGKKIPKDSVILSLNNKTITSKIGLAMERNKVKAPKTYTLTIETDKFKRALVKKEKENKRDMKALNMKDSAKGAYADGKKSQAVGNIRKTRNATAKAAGLAYGAVTGAVAGALPSAILAAELGAGFVAGAALIGLSPVIALASLVGGTAAATFYAGFKIYEVVKYGKSNKKKILKPMLTIRKYFESHTKGFYGIEYEMKDKSKGLEKKDNVTDVAYRFYKKQQKGKKLNAFKVNKTTTDRYITYDVIDEKNQPIFTITELRPDGSRPIYKDLKRTFFKGIIHAFSFRGINTYFDIGAFGAEDDYSGLFYDVKKKTGGKRGEIFQVEKSLTKGTLLVKLTDELINRERTKKALEVQTKLIKYIKAFVSAGKKGKNTTKLTKFGKKAMKNVKKENVENVKKTLKKLEQKKKFTSAPAFDPLPFANQVKRKEHKLYKNLRY